MVQNIISMRDELMEKVQFPGGGGIGFPEEMSFKRLPKKQTEQETDKLGVGVPQEGSISKETLESCIRGVDKGGREWEEQRGQFGLYFTKDW